MKKLFCVIALSVFFVNSFVFAAETTLVGEPAIITDLPMLTNQSSVFEGISSLVTSEKNLVKLKARGAALIKERLLALSNLKKSINGAKYLLEEEKKQVLANIETEITNLNSLGEKIKIGTSLEMVKKDVKAIYTDHRVFGIFIPKINLSNKLAQANFQYNKMTEYFIKVQTAIGKTISAKKDVSIRQTNLDKARALMPEIKKAIVAAESLVVNLKPSDYPNNSSVEIKNINTSIRNIFQKLKNVRTLASSGKVLK